MAASLVADAQKSQGLHYRNPRLPLNCKLPDNLECGTKIYIHGAVALQPTRFSINLKDAGVNANTFFHFNPRFGDENVVVRNSRYNEAWGTEERDGDNPFVPGEEFLICINPTADGYEVEVNGNLFTVFQHRDEMPLCNVTHLTMKGDVVCYGIHIPLSVLPVPLILAVPGKTCIGDMFFINGEVPGGSDRFAVNLQCGSEDNADVMLHLNPRFGDGEVVCNSKCGDSWNEEVRDGLPIGPGDRFDLCIAASNEAYHTFLNGSTFIKFSHRMDMRSACTLFINGDITVYDLRIDCPPSKLPPHIGDEKIRDFEESTVETFYPPNPATLALLSPLEPGNVVILSGMVDADATRCKINFQSGSDDDSDIALHFNPRWDDEPTIVLNSRAGGEWGEELREPNQLSPGSWIEMHVAIKDSGYSIALNGSVLPEFGHRLDCRTVTHVVVDGCLAVQRLIASA